MIGDAGAQPHPILMDENGNRVVNRLMVNNGCAVDPTSTGVTVLRWPGNVVDIGPGEVNPDGMAFCWATDSGGGRVLVAGDSGFLAEPNLPGSGPGLFDQGDNVRFVEQAIGWLLE